VALDRSLTRYTNDPAALFTAREDRVRGSGLSLSYQPDRSLSVSLSLRAEARDSNQAAFAYRARMATVSAQFTF
jgi:hypothetical protein